MADSRRSLLLEDLAVLIVILSTMTLLSLFQGALIDRF